MLRSAAIGAVLFDHLSRELGRPRYGAVGRAGVLLFFIHTALVLMFSLERLQSRGPRVTIPFYLQRAFRIFPLCWFCIAVVILFQIPSSPFAGQYNWQGWGWVVKNVLLIQNFTLSSFVSGPMWSLAYEVQMYLALPFIYFLAKRRGGLVWIVFISITSALATFALSRIYVQLYGPKYDELLLHLPVTYFVPCFLAGVIAFILSRKKHLSLSPAILPLAVIAFVLGVIYSPINHFDWWGCTAIGILLPQLTEIRYGPVQVICHEIAKYSYGVYLAHTPLLWFVFQRIQFSGIGGWALFLILLLAVPVACYHWIEKPMIDVGRKVARRWLKTEKSIQFGALRPAIGHDAGTESRYVG